MFHDDAMRDGCDHVRCNFLKKKKLNFSSFKIFLFVNYLCFPFKFFLIDLKSYVYLHECVYHSIVVTHY